MALSFQVAVKTLLKGLERLAQAEEFNLQEVAISIAERRIQNKARALVAGFDEVISASRDEYLKRLSKLGQPNPKEVRNRLRQELDSLSREIRSHLRVIAVKAEVLLLDAKELGINLPSDIENQLTRLSQIEANALDKIVEMIIGIVQETLDRFGCPLNS